MWVRGWLAVFGWLSWVGLDWIEVGGGGWIVSASVRFCVQQTVIIMPCPAIIDSMKYLQHEHCVHESSWARIYRHMYGLFVRLI